MRESESFVPEQESTLNALRSVGDESFVQYRNGIKGQIYWDCLTAQGLEDELESSEDSSEGED